MENPKSEKRPDRRSLYSKMVIKEAMLELKKTMPFNEITITGICKEAGINRGTFYLHYGNTMQVLDELIDEVLELSLDDPRFVSLDYDYSDPFVDNKCRVPICEIIRNSEKYKCIFLDEGLTSYIASKIMKRHVNNFVDTMTKKTGLSENELHNFYYFRLMGCLAVVRKTIDYDNNAWREVKEFIDNIQRTGVKPYMKQ